MLVKLSIQVNGYQILIFFFVSCSARTPVTLSNISGNDKLNYRINICTTNQTSILVRKLLKKWKVKGLGIRNLRNIEPMRFYGKSFFKEGINLIYSIIDSMKVEEEELGEQIMRMEGTLNLLTGGTAPATWKLWDYEGDEYADIYTVSNSGDTIIAIGIDLNSPVLEKIKEKLDHKIEIYYPPPEDETLAL